MPWCDVLYYPILYCTILYRTILCCTALYYTDQLHYYTVLHYTSLYCTVMYNLCYTILYYPIPYCTYCESLCYCVKSNYVWTTAFHLTSSSWFVKKYFWSDRCSDPQPFYLVLVLPYPYPCSSFFFLSLFFLLLLSILSHTSVPPSSWPCRYMSIFFMSLSFLLHTSIPLFSYLCHSFFPHIPYGSFLFIIRKWKYQNQFTKTSDKRNSYDWKQISL